jgi:hypothetical protein
MERTAPHRSPSTSLQTQPRPTRTPPRTSTLANALHASRRRHRASQRGPAAATNASRATTPVALPIPANHRNARRPTLAQHRVAPHLAALHPAPNPPLMGLRPRKQSRWNAPHRSPSTLPQTHLARSEHHANLDTRKRAARIAPTSPRIPERPRRGYQRLTRNNARSAPNPRNPSQRPSTNARRASRRAHLAALYPAPNPPLMSLRPRKQSRANAPHRSPSTPPQTHLARSRTPREPRHTQTRCTHRADLTAHPREAPPRLPTPLEQHRP